MRESSLRVAANRWFSAANVQLQRSTLEELGRSPVGRFVAGDTWLHFCATPKLWGVILWGRPDEKQAVQLGQSLRLELFPPAEPHAALVDASRIEGGDPRAFQAAGRYISHNKSKLSSAVTRLALIRPSGVDGALVAGAYEVLPKPYPVSVFVDAREAIAWLAIDFDPATLVELHAQASSTPIELGALRALLDSRLEGIAIAKAAKELGMSERSLQRKLAEAHTTFTDELADARVRAAKRLLLESRATLTEIAFDVGCASLQNFSALFRRRTGESPSTFRAKHRGSP